MIDKELLTEIYLTNELQLTAADKEVIWKRWKNGVNRNLPTVL